MAVFDIFGENKRGLKYDLPYHEFSENDMIAVKKLIIEWKSTSSKVIGLVSIDLIDKSPTNPYNAFTE